MQNPEPQIYCFLLPAVIGEHPDPYHKTLRWLVLANDEGKLGLKPVATQDAQFQSISYRVVDGGNWICDSPNHNTFFFSQNLIRDYMVDRPLMIKVFVSSIVP